MAQIREYEIIEGPAVGTFGKTFIGRHRFLQKVWALKQLHSFVRPEVIKHEADTLKEVRSPYVVQIHDFFIDRKKPTIVMEYCPRGLDSYLKERFEQTSGKIPYNEARQLLYAVLQGLNDAHKAGIIHGDIKPANVRFGEDKTPKLGDFGAARYCKSKDVDVEKHDETESDDIEDIPEAAVSLRGSTNWMAPELLRGECASEESDYFSFGVLAYLVLSGRHPFFANDPSCLTSEEDKIISQTFSPIHLRDLREDVPARVADLILELMSEPSARKTAELSLKAALSEQIEDTVTPPGERIAQIGGPTEDDINQIRNAYQRAKHSFFVLFRPKEAVDELTSFLQEFKWERFKGRHFSELADAWSLRAYINNSGGLFQEAINACENALTVDSKHVNSLHACGYAYLQMGRYDEAERDLSSALELADSSAKRAQIRRLLDTIRLRKTFSSQATDSQSY